MMKNYYLIQYANEKKPQLIDEGYLALLNEKEDKFSLVEVLDLEGATAYNKQNAHT